jgi:muramoyltetrapeptide carboxypeptidase
MYNAAKITIFYKFVKTLLSPMKRIAAPPYLRPGDRIALISPSFHAPMSDIEGAAGVLRAWGFEPVVGAHADRQWRGSYAGTPEERLADLRAALEDPTVKAIVCNRGGYGTIRFAEMLTLEELAAHPKWLVGFSDITTLSGMEARAGVMSIHGTMGKFLAKSQGQDASSTLLRDLLTGTVPEYALPAHPLSRPGSATAPLVGGNLSTLVPVLGTRADATAGREILLFLEEVEEDFTHIDRLFSTLRLRGVLERCRGVILGEFTDCAANLGYGSAEELICSYLKDYDIPVCCGFPAGHGQVNLPLLIGARSTLAVTEAGATLTFHVRGRKKRV